MRVSFQIFKEKSKTSFISSVSFAFVEVFSDKTALLRHSSFCTSLHGRKPAEMIRNDEVRDLLTRRLCDSSLPLSSLPRDAIPGGCAPAALRACPDPALARGASLARGGESPGCAMALRSLRPDFPKTLFPPARNKDKYFPDPAALRVRVLPPMHACTDRIRT